MSFIDIMAWSAAEDAASAARSAQDAADRARESAEELEYSRIKHNRKETVNKMLQDMFYNREVDYYKVADVKNILNSYPYRTVLPLDYSSNDRFPYISFALSILSGFITYDSFNYVILSLFILIFLSFSLLFKQWLWWKINKKRVQAERLENIEKMYDATMRRLAHEYPMLSKYGILKKYNIDSSVLQTYKILLSQDKAVAKKSLLKLYYLLLDLDEGYRFSTEYEKVLTTIFLEYPEIQNLDKQNLLFQQAALNLYEKHQSSS